MENPERFFRFHLAETLGVPVCMLNKIPAREIDEWAVYFKAKNMMHEKERAEQKKQSRTAAQINGRG